MKRTMSKLVAIIIVATITLQLKAQNNIAKAEIKIKNNQAKSNSSYENNTATNNETGSLSKASTKALKNFSKLFNSPANTTWYGNDENGFNAYFKVNDVTTHVNYNKKGNWVYSISNYTENELPSDIREAIEASYPAHVVNGVQEVHIKNLMAYIIHVESKDGYKTLRYTNEGGVEQIDELLKFKDDVK